MKTSQKSLDGHDEERARALEIAESAIGRQPSTGGRMDRAQQEVCLRIVLSALSGGTYSIQIRTEAAL